MFGVAIPVLVADKICLYALRFDHLCCATQLWIDCVARCWRVVQEEKQLEQAAHGTQEHTRRFHVQSEARGTSCSGVTSFPAASNMRKARSPELHVHVAAQS
jgi:hypothetical protein